MRDVLETPASRLRTEQSDRCNNDDVTRRDGDDEGIPETPGHGDALLDQQRWYPVGKAVVPDRLKQVEREKHDQARAVRRLPHLTEFGDTLNGHFDRR